MKEVVFMLFISMLLLGSMIGFVGTGGAGLTITLLSVGFNIPIYTALGVALTSMVFTTLSGTISHLREHEVEVKTGLTIGLGGIMGAFIGANVSNTIPSDILKILTASMMLLSSLILYLKVYQTDFMNRHIHIRTDKLIGKKFYIYGILLGIGNGFLSGAFGIGAAAFIQITLLIVFGTSLLKTVGTCMLIILPISTSGGFGYLLNGHLDFPIFIQTFLGLVIGAYIGSKFTHLAPRSLLKFCMVALSFLGGLIMLLFS